MATPIRIALLLGSTRQSSNCTGFAAWLTSAFLSLPPTSPPIELVPVDLSSTSYTLGPLLSPLMPGAIHDSSLYPTPAIRAWSTLVRSCTGFVVLSPQYNWGYPGELKNALDHLFHEWAKKPVVVVTYGGHGGNKCAEQLRAVLMGGLKMEVLEEQPQIVLPREYIVSEKRVSTAASVELHGKEGDTDPFLQAYVEKVKAALEALVTKVTTPSRKEE